MEEYTRLCRWEDNIKIELNEMFVGLRVLVAMETMWKNTGGFVDGRTILR